MFFELVELDDPHVEVKAGVVEMVVQLLGGPKTESHLTCRLRQQDGVLALWIIGQPS